MFKKLCSMMLAIAMIMACVPTPALAMEGEWQYLAPMPTARANAAVGYYDGKIYVAGGEKAASTIATTIEIYDIETGTWSTSPTASPVVERNTTSAASGSKMYFWGGFTVSMGVVNYPKTYRRYDIETDTWSNAWTMSYERIGSSAAALDGKMYFMGGYAPGATSGTYKNTTSVEILDIETGARTVGTTLPVGTQSMSSVGYKGNIYVIGGYQTPNLGNSKYDSLYILDTNTGQWQAGANLADVRALSTSQAYDNKIYTIGGQNSLNTAITNVDIYDIESNSWTDGIPMNTARSNAGSIIVDDVLYVFGGVSATGAYSNTVEAIRLAPATPTPEPGDKELAILLYEGETLRLLSPEDIDDTADITWTSSDSSIVSVNSSGRITANGRGAAYIYAEDADLDFYAAIPIVVESENGNEENYRMAMQLAMGSTQRLNLKGAEGETISWTSFDTDIATVTQDGVITPVGSGLVIIQAECGGETYHMYIKI